MSKHTPGPWNVAPRTGRYQVTPHDERERIALEKISALEFEALSVGHAGGQIAVIPLDESNMANARLISAAPDLLFDLCEAATTLRRYESLHRAKNTEESTAKAEVNATLAARFERTIAKAKGIDQ